MSKFAYLHFNFYQGTQSGLVKNQFTVYNKKASMGSWIIKIFSLRNLNINTNNPIPLEQKKNIIALILIAFNKNIQQQKLEFSNINIECFLLL